MGLLDKSSFIFTSDQWQKVCSPWRPSFSDEIIYKNIISRFDSRSPVLILGATPEIRDIIYEFKFDERFVVDVSAEMFKEMGLIRENKIDNEEKFIEANWLSLPFEPSSFEAIVSDLPFWVLFSLEEHEIFLKECHRVLKKNGSFIVRTHFIDINLWLLSPEALIRWIYQQGFKKIWSPKRFQNFFSSILVDYCTDPNIYTFNREKCFVLLNQYLNDQWIKKFFLEHPKILSGAFYKPLNYLINYLELKEEIVLLPHLNHLINYFVKSCAVECIVPISHFLSLAEGKFFIKKIFFHYDLPNSPQYPILWLEKK